MTISRPVRRLMALALVAVLALGVAACGDSNSSSSGGSKATTSASSSKQIQKNGANASKTITVGSKNFTEQIVLGEIYAQALQAAGYTVKKQLNLGDEKTALKALKGGQIDGYPEYTGTALLSFFNVPSDKLPKDATAAYDQVKADFAKDGIDALKPTPFTSSNEVALTKAKADELGVKTISDLSGKAKTLTLYGSPECRQRLDCLLGLEKVYGLKFKKFVPVDIGLRHEVLQKGQADVSIVFTTDPQIKRNNEVLLEDDKGMFPPYNPTFLVKQATVTKDGPDLQKTIDLVSTGLTDAVMQELNARVDLDKKTATQVAKEYLTESGYLG